MKRNFEENNIILIFAVDRITENLRTDIDWWNTALNKKDQNYPSYAFEITQYSDSEKNENPSTIVTQLYPINHEQIISNKRKNNSKRPIRTFEKWIELPVNNTEEKTCPCECRHVARFICRQHPDN